MLVCSSSLFGDRANAYITDPIVVPANPTVNDSIIVEFGFCDIIEGDSLIQEGNVIKLTIDNFHNPINLCNFPIDFWNTEIGKLPVGQYELEYYKRVDDGDGFGDFELQAVIPFTVNGIAVPVNHWLTLVLLIIEVSWLVMRSCFSMRWLFLIFPLS